ncbi:GAF and ANTAR domain-containing protein [Mycolicibacterium porcinum]|uniref:GAF and ANTAR domain-containing protein n=1 Tax=Mycolicibacterium porcinum TaxID=39693 RepID=UPI000848D202|nr:GAF and ANTAR domain-containing protein [Mycolicibacterium porcinum]ODR26159.1 response regulator receiver protein [Mycolicibacterium porcinum]
MSLSRQEMIATQVNELIRVIEGRPQADLDTALSDLVDSAVGYVPGAEYAAITIADHSGGIRTAAATGEYPWILDQIQQRWGQGPCHGAAWEHHTVKIDDMRTDGRWPDYCREVIATTPIRSVVAYQLYADHHTTGALNFYARKPGVFDGTAVEAGMVVATHIALAWHLALRDKQFRNALTSRDIIGQAKGIYMERHKIDASQAFEVLKRLSQNSNTPLIDIAHQIVRGECRSRVCDN